ncbi:E3 ubiquitin-protein ligase RNF8-like [Cucurbita maxima]|uniref:E3 ubiquitin-protein ligase RNF8-like n=1 Tax=Cucurbita maxima TaxID=3661 RepID=A0A6J1JVK9_CUCMA|nr:E3 ubiquitin-protein ligase RNF8-like [Cucurbita maxima]
MEGDRRRITLYDQMLAVGDGREFARGLTLNDVLTIHNRASPSPSPAVRLNGRTLLDIIRDDVGISPVGNRERKSWKFLRDRLRLNLRSQILSPNSLRIPSFSSAEMMPSEEQSSESTTTTGAAPSLRQISRRSSSRLSLNARPKSEAANSGDSPENNNSSTASGSGSRRSLQKPQMSRHSSTRFTLERSESFTDLSDPARDGARRLSAALAMERSMSARETVVAQEAADAESTAHEEEQEEEQEQPEQQESSSAAPVRMSLMDLLEETDRKMGLEGSRYRIEEEEEEEEEEIHHKVTAKRGGEHSWGAERRCCVCMVRYKGAAFIPCGHTFCRLCSRELWVSRGNCPLCNGFILEILDIF